MLVKQIQTTALAINMRIANAYLCHHQRNLFISILKWNFCSQEHDTKKAYIKHISHADIPSPLGEPGWGWMCPLWDNFRNFSLLMYLKRILWNA